MKIECIHFDLDSVLYLPADFLAATLSLSVKTMLQYGLKASLDEALHCLLEIRAEDANGVDHFDRLCCHFNGESDPVIIAAGVEKYRDSKLANMMAAPHAHFVLDRLSGIYPLTIISNGVPVKQAGKLVRLGLSHYFADFDHQGTLIKRHFYATDRADQAKPLPYLWERAIQDLGVSASGSVMIGDRYWADILGAKRLGMTTVKINQGEHSQESREAAYDKNIGKQLGLSRELMPCQDAVGLMTPDFSIDSLVGLLGVINDLEERGEE